MKNGKIYGFWNNYENCKEEALKYNTRTKLFENSKGCYYGSKRNNWFDDICSHMIEKRKPKNYWTKEKCKDEALKYDFKTEFRKNIAYDIAFKNNWLEEISKHLKEKRKPNGFWNNYENCKEEALKYNTRTEFREKSTIVCIFAKKNNWLDDICSHMEILGNKMKRCIYAIEFSDNNVYVGLTFNIKKRYTQHLNKGTVHNYIKKTKLSPNLIKLTDYISISDAKTNEKKYLNLYKKNKWNILNKIKTGGLGGNTLFWTKEKCIKEALKYKTKKDFRENCYSAYSSAKSKGWLKETQKHLISKYKPNGFWNDYENCKEEALKYKNKKDFRRKSATVYESAKLNEWLDEIQEHMIEKQKPKGFWNDYENCKEEALKYITKTDFINNSQTCYHNSCKNNWINEICSHMIKKSTRFWTYDKCKKEALKYKNKQEFNKKSPSAYKANMKYKYNLNELFCNLI